MSALVRDQLHAAARRVEECGDIDKAIASAEQRRNRTLALAAAAGLAAVVVLASVVSNSPLNGVQPEPMQPTPTPSPESGVNGWPTTTRNAAGDYSLGDRGCGGPSAGTGRNCIYGFMHNGYGSADVDIRIDMGSAEAILDDGGMPVSVAGHDGTYRQLTAGQELWTVDIDGTPVAINVTAKPGTSRADLAEAHAIIDSMRTEPSDNDVGFRLVFTLTTNDWDSG